MKILHYIDTPLNDTKINSISHLVITTIGEYLDNIKLEENPFQRAILSTKFYSKLIDDILNDTIIPPISIMSNEKPINFANNNLSLENNFIILDGLQRTNCLFHCVELLKNNKTKDTFYKDEKSFKDKKIYLEIWEKMDFKSILYKMLVLNTGQRKMDYSHQLDILNITFFEKLESDNINVVKYYDQNKEKNKEYFKLSDVTEGLVSYINKYPISGKKNAAEFLFERFNISIESNEEEDSLITIYDDNTYKYIKWILTDFSKSLDIIYKENNPLKKYNVFLIGFCASVGYSYSKNPKNLEDKINILEKKIEENQDPLRLDLFENFYNKFTSGIGEKRRKFVFETFRDFFVSPEHLDIIEWDNIYERYFG